MHSNGLGHKFNGNASKSANGIGSKSLGKASRLPNPELFPFLSRRLAASGVDIPGVNRFGENVDEESDDEEDEVDAAQAMLSLKHGPRVIIPKTGTNICRQPHHYILLALYFTKKYGHLIPNLSIYTLLSEDIYKRPYVRKMNSQRTRKVCSPISNLFWGEPKIHLLIL